MAAAVSGREVVAADKRKDADLAAPLNAESQAESSHVSPRVRIGDCGGTTTPGAASSLVMVNSANSDCCGASSPLACAHLDGSQPSHGDRRCGRCQAFLENHALAPGAFCCGRLTRKGCAVAWVVAIFCTLGFTELGVQTIGRLVAESAVQSADVHFSTVDIGVVNSSLRYFPRIVGTVGKPSPFDALFYAMDADILARTDRGMEKIGIVRLPELRVQGNLDLQLDLPVEFTVSDLDVFGRAGKQFVVADTTAWRLQATGRTLAWVFGFIPIYMWGISFNKTVHMDGFSGFSQNKNPVVMDSMTKAYGEAGKLDVVVMVNLTNPSYVAAQVATPMYFNITQRGKTFGVAVMENIVLRPGVNTIPVMFGMENDEKNVEAVEAFVAGYVQANAVEPVTMHGSMVSSPSDPFLGRVLDGMEMTFNFKPPGTRFVVEIEAFVALSGLKAKATAFNPLPDDIFMESIDIWIDEGNYLGDRVFTLDSKKSRTGIPGQVLSPAQRSILDIDLNLFDAHLTDFRLVGRLIKYARGGAILTGVNGTVDVVIKPSFKLRVPLAMNNITCILKCPIWCRHPGVDHVPLLSRPRVNDGLRTGNTSLLL